MKSAAAKLPLPVLDPPRDVALERARWNAREHVLLFHPADQAVKLRPAGPADAREIHGLIDSYARQGLLLHRTLDDVCRTIRDFVVAVEGDRIVGCGALRIYSHLLAEVGALAVAADHQGRGIGARIVRTLEAEALAYGIRRIFALTLQDGFFHRIGYQTVDVRDFPEKIARDCMNCDRRLHCTEIAVARVITVESTADGRA